MSVSDRYTMVLMNSRSDVVSQRSLRLCGNSADDLDAEEYHIKAKAREMYIDAMCVVGKWKRTA